MYKYIHFFFLTFCLKQSFDLLISDSTNVPPMIFCFLFVVYVGHRAVLVQLTKLQLTKLDLGIDLFLEQYNGEKINE